MGGDEPETPKYEKLQAKFANGQFEKGAQIRSDVSSGSYGDARKNESGRMESAGSGVEAARQKQNFEASRLANKTKYAGDTIDTQQIDNLGLAGKGGIDVGASANRVARGTREMASIGSIMSKNDSEKVIQDMYEKNAKKQAVFDVAKAGVTAYAHSQLDAGKDPLANETQNGLEQGLKESSAPVTFDAPINYSGMSSVPKRYT
jgi:hypothetical protein